jgi:ABC-type multidrug transport system fused ATPase/permease subunit
VNSGGNGALSLDAVSFAYPSQPEKNVLQSVSLNVPSGQRVALLGGSGSGKSTIFALALRFYAPDSGQVRLGGADVASLPDAELRRRVAWVPQEPPLFPNATLRENIAYGLPGCPAGAAEAAAREAHAEAFIRATPHGFETRLGTAGAALSGGQKQRVALARALVRDPDLLLLDEATSALDPESGRRVEAALARAAARRTVLFTTHRVAQARRADRIVVLAHGRIVEDGTHDQLLRRDGAYANLVRAGDGVSEQEACVHVDLGAGLETEVEECRVENV